MKDKQNRPIQYYVNAQEEGIIEKTAKALGLSISALSRMAALKISMALKRENTTREGEVDGESQ